MSVQGFPSLTCPFDDAGVEPTERPTSGGGGFFSLHVWQPPEPGHPGHWKQIRTGYTEDNAAAMVRRLSAHGRVVEARSSGVTIRGRRSFWRRRML